jgi:REP element-mobilizing transposase RayT
MLSNVHDCFEAFMREVGSIPHSEPLAFFLTWTTYGSWLPGDDRGWVDGRGGCHAPEPLRAAAARRRMTEETVTFEGPQRVAVEEAIAAHCRVRGWHLHAVQCRLQHVHVVVTAIERAPGDVMTQLKSWCTRALKELAGSRGAAPRKRWWTEGGSQRHIFHEGDLASVVAYVNECQGVPVQAPVAPEA